MQNFVSISMVPAIWLFQSIQGLIFSYYFLSLCRHFLNYFPFSIVSLETERLSVYNVIKNGFWKWPVS